MCEDDLSPPGHGQLKNTSNTTCMNKAEIRGESDEAKSVPGETDLIHF